MVRATQAVERVPRKSYTQELKAMRLALGNASSACSLAAAAAILLCTGTTLLALGCHPQLVQLTNSPRWESAGVLLLSHQHIIEGVAAPMCGLHPQLGSRCCSPVQPWATAHTPCPPPCGTTEQHSLRRHTRHHPHTHTHPRYATQSHMHFPVHTLLAAMDSSAGCHLLHTGPAAWRWGAEPGMSPDMWQGWGVGSHSPHCLAPITQASARLQAALESWTHPG